MFRVRRKLLEEDDNSIMRTCYTCGVEKKLTTKFFRRDKRFKEKVEFQGRCIDCVNDYNRIYYKKRKKANDGVNPYKHKQREYTLRFKYGLRPEDVPKHCEICGSNKKICVDHCHGTGKLRGFLCDACNVTLGKTKDNPTTLRHLAEYLEKHEDRSNNSNPPTNGVRCAE